MLRQPSFCQKLSGGGGAEMAKPLLITVRGTAFGGDSYWCDRPHVEKTLATVPRHPDSLLMTTLFHTQHCQTWLAVSLVEDGLRLTTAGSCNDDGLLPL